MIDIEGVKAYSTKEAAEALNVSEKTIREYCKSGQLKARRIGRPWYIPVEELQAFIRGQGSKEEG